MSVISTTDPTFDLVAEQRQASLELAAPRLDGYETLELIGEGTYGEVWRATETQTSVIVAIKRLRQQPSEQCCQETEHLAKLNSVRGIVALRKVHLNAEPYCYVMEHLPGGTLTGLIARDKKLAFQDAWDKFRRMVEALCYVHRDGIVHGDIKPDNILLDSAGHPRICDFGQARALGSRGHVLGTPYYMPPEQARLEGLPDPRWDVYALGAILFEMLTGTKPRFDAAMTTLLTSPANSGTEARLRLEHYARNLEQNPTLDAHRHVCGVDSAVAKLVNRCLSLDFQDRPADANAVWKQIEQCERIRRSKPLFLFGGIAPAILFLVLGVVMLIGSQSLIKRITRQWESNIAKSNLAVAQAIGSAIRDSFDDRMKIVQDAARDVSWQTLDRSGMDSELKRLYKENRRQIFRWSFVDAQGDMVATFGRVGEDGKKSGVDATTLGKNFSWRAWFHGGLEDGKESLNAKNDEMIAAFRRRTGRKASIGQPYWRVGDQTFAVVSVTCPVAADDTQPPAGLLTGSFAYADVIRSIDAFEQEQGDGKLDVVVVNNNFQVIYSSQMVEKIAEMACATNESERVEIAKQNPLKISVPKDSHYQKALAHESMLGAYVDPMDGRKYLGSSALAKLQSSQQLAVIVQQKEADALEPITTLRSAINGFAIALMIVGTLFLAINTYALYWFLRHQRESAAYV
jgi:serine/threonine protein kinase/phosphoribosylformylglycinamidine (FGAM) synthase-like amidotransferase family enzyme